MADISAFFRTVFQIIVHNAMRAKSLAVGWAKRILTFLLGTPQFGLLSQHLELTIK